MKDRIQEIDEQIAMLYGKLHETAYSVVEDIYGNVQDLDPIVEQIAALKIERAKWTSK